MSREEVRLVRYPKFDLKFLTENSEYNIRYDSEDKTAPSDDYMGNRVLNLTTKNAMEDDSAVFSFLLSGDVYWDKVLTPNDVVILKIMPDDKKTTSEQEDINDVILVGLVNEVRLEADYGENSKMYRISGQSFAKLLIDFELGVIQEVSVVLSEIGWLPDSAEDGTMTFTDKSASEIAHSMMTKFMQYARYEFSDGRTASAFLKYDDLDSWTEYENLTDPSPFINYEGSLKQLLDDITEKPFNELFFDFTKEETCNMIMRRTPFDEADWNKLPIHKITSKTVISESVARSDTEAYSIFNVLVNSPIGMESVDFGSFPRYHQELVDKYGYSKLELNNKYLMKSLDATGDNDSKDTIDKPEGEEMIMEATAYSRKQVGLSDTTVDGTNLIDRPKVVAVDPSVIPLGSTVWIEGMGNYHAGDTGGDIKGKRIDIHMTSVEDCIAFGRKKVKVVVKKKGGGAKKQSSPVRAMRADTPATSSTALNILYKTTVAYLESYSLQELRVKKDIVATKIANIDPRISMNEAQKIIQTYLVSSSISIEKFSEITGLNDSNIEDIGDRAITYSKLKKFLKDYADKNIADKVLVRDAIMSEFKDINRDDAMSIATTFLNNNGKIDKKEYDAVFKKGKDGKPEPQEANSENLKIFTNKIANWYAENSNYYAGEIKVVGSPEYRIGNRLSYLDEQNSELWEYYIEGVQHEYSYSTGFTTTLSVTRGLQQGGLKRFTNLWNKSEEFKGGLLGEKSLDELFSEGNKGKNKGNNGGSSNTQGGGSSTHDGSVGASGVYQYLAKIAEDTISHFGNMRITSGYREGDPYYHGRRQAIDIAFPASMNGSAENTKVANWVFEKYPKEVAYVITNGRVRDRVGLSGTGNSGQWVTWADNDHYDHVHINGALGEGEVRK